MLVLNEWRICYALFDVYWVKAFVMEVFMYISGFCIYASVRFLDKVCWLQMTSM